MIGFAFEGRLYFVSWMPLVLCYLFGIFLVQDSIIWSFALKVLENRDYPSERSRNETIAYARALQ